MVDDEDGSDGGGYGGDGGEVGIRWRRFQILSCDGHRRIINYHW